MARPRTFDRDLALGRAQALFWAQGYSGASNAELLRAMEIGSQSLYAAYGDKLSLFCEALALHADERLQAQARLLRSSPSPLRSVRAWLLGSILPHEGETRIGCMLVNATAEFGTSDDVVLNIIARAQDALVEAISARLQDARLTGQIDAELDPHLAAGSLAATLQGLRLAGRRGGPEAALQHLAGATLQRLTDHRHPPG